MIERRVERVGDQLGDGGDADVPGDVALELALRQAELPEAPRDEPAGVVAGQEERRRAVRGATVDRLRLVVGKQIQLQSSSVSVVSAAIHWGRS